MRKEQQVVKAFKAFKVLQYKVFKDKQVLLKEQQVLKDYRVYKERKDCRELKD
jgi:hypothetical protein